MRPGCPTVTVQRYKFIFICYFYLKFSTMIFFPGCKINIGLHVVSKRADGYHDLETLMFPVRGLCDAVEIMMPQSNPSVRTTKATLGVVVTWSR